jgi:glycosyltransferase involved in cell wall biosynthesis
LGNIGSMKIIFSSYNTLSAGTSNVTRFIIKSLTNKKTHHKVYFFIPQIDLFAQIQTNQSVKIFKIPLFTGYIKFLCRVLYDFVFLPLISIILNPSAVIVLANYSPMVVRGKKIVFLRHPFLVEDLGEFDKDFNRVVIEKLRKIIFKITLLTTDIIIVQTDHMKRAFLKKYGYVKQQIHVLPNPLSNLIDNTPSDSASLCNKENMVLYVSRFAPHKQHMFLLRLVDKYRDEFGKKSVKFFVTVDPAKSIGDPQAFLNEIDKRQLNKIIYNLGELPNEQLSQYYRSAKCLFFPSINETFGNPLIEAMAFGLPIIVPNLDYAKSICGDAGIYYKSDNMDEAYEKISAIIQDNQLQEVYSQHSRLRMKQIPTVEQWVDKIFSLAK